jgi:hypothetical protein
MKANHNINYSILIILCSNYDNIAIVIKNIKSNKLIKLYQNKINRKKNTYYRTQGC